MYYVIQENIYKEYHFNTLMDFLKRYNLEHELIPWRPFDTQAVKIKTDRKDVWFFGSIDDGMELQKQGWYPGIMYNEGHDFDMYLQKYGENVLNSDAIIQEVGTLDPFRYTHQFIRPTRDTKIFTSQVYEVNDWNSYIEGLAPEDLANIRAKTKMMYCWPKENIQQEIRCFIIDGEPVTISQYKIGRRVNMLNMDNNQEAYIFAKQMAKIYSPSRVFVLDICLYNDEYRIVEINCANMSGFYDIDMSKLMQSLENTFNHERTRTTATPELKAGDRLAEGHPVGHISDGPDGASKGSGS
jgi:hypothetical protein